MNEFRPVSFAQQRLWFLDQFEPGNSAYNLASAMPYHGSPGFRRAGAPLQAIVRRHDSLRTTFAAVDGQVMAVVCAAESTAVPFVNLDHLPDDQKEEHALRMAAEEAQRRFDLSSGPLIRFKVLRLSATEHILVLAMHHIVMDGWSIGVLLKELAGFYWAFHAKRPPEIPGASDPIQRFRGPGSASPSPAKRRPVNSNTGSEP